jgi:UDP-glucose 4-epimerase
MPKTKILVTGVGGYWGSRVAQRLVENPNFRVLGLDTEAPKEPIPGLDFIQADIRNPLLSELFKSEKVGTVYHMAFKESQRPSEEIFDYNLMGTMKVFGAGAAAGVTKIIFKSSTAVYGAFAKNPAFIMEDSALNGSRAFGTVRDLVEIEAFCNGYRRQFPEVKLTVLRFANILGPTADTHFSRYLETPVSSTLLGFNPMMQLIHEEDALEAIVHAGSGEYPGVFNIAALDLMPLTKILGLLDQPHFPVFHLFAYWGYRTMGGRGLRLSRHVPIELDYIRYRWVGDLHRMQQILNFSPKFSVEEILHQFSEARRTKRYIPEAISRAYEIDRMRKIIERRHPDEPVTDGGEDMERETHD